MNYELIGYIGGGLLSFQLIPQIIKIYRQGDASQLSYAFMLCNWLGLGCMTVYGVTQSDRPLYIPASISLFNTSILISQKCFYDCSTQESEEVPLSFSSEALHKSDPIDIPRRYHPPLSRSLPTHF